MAPVPGRQAAEWVSAAERVSAAVQGLAVPGQPLRAAGPDLFFGQAAEIAPRMLGGSLSPGGPAGK